MSASGENSSEQSFRYGVIFIYTNVVNAYDIVFSYPSESNKLSESSAHLNALGWREYILPDGSSYYHNLLVRVTTNLDLRNVTCLQRVSDVIDEAFLSTSDPKKLSRDKIELWIRGPGLEQYWIDHKSHVAMPRMFGETATLDKHSAEGPGTPDSSRLPSVSQGFYQISTCNVLIGSFWRVTLRTRCLRKKFEREP